MKRVLIVDDDRSTLLSLKMLLKYTRKDLKVEAVSSFRDAVRRLTRKNIDLVLSDVNLGSEYGPDIKKLFSDVPFIYLTGDNGWSSKDGSKVLYKPYKLDDLSSSIDAVLGESVSLKDVVKSISARTFSVSAAVDNLLRS